jgi:hypothetical protein
MVGRDHHVPDLYYRPAQKYPPLRSPYFRNVNGYLKAPNEENREKGFYRFICHVGTKGFCIQHATNRANERCVFVVNQSSEAPFRGKKFRANPLVAIARSSGKGGERELSRCLSLGCKPDHPAATSCAGAADADRPSSIAAIQNSLAIVFS